MIEILATYKELAPWIVPIVTGLTAAFLIDFFRRRSRKSKQIQFIKEINDLNKSLKSTPKTPELIKERQDHIEDQVKILSRKIFKDDEPQFDSIRLSTTVYESMKCKWCSQDHKPHDGPLGQCMKCKIPLDVWIGCQK